MHKYVEKYVYNLFFTNFLGNIINFLVALRLSRKPGHFLLEAEITPGFGFCLFKTYQETFSRNREECTMEKPIKKMY